MSPLIQGKAAVLGLGIIGSRSFARLRDAGVDAICWNRTPQGLAEEASSPAAAVDGAHVISLYLKDAPAVREVIARIGHLLHAGQTLLNHSTLDLDTTLWLAGVCEARGCRFLDAPFTGSKLAALNGQLVYYIGGDEDLAAELEPFLSITSRSRVPTGRLASVPLARLRVSLSPTTNSSPMKVV